MDAQNVVLTAGQVVLVLAPVVVPRLLWARRQEQRLVGIVLPSKIPNSRG